MQETQLFLVARMEHICIIPNIDKFSQILALTEVDLSFQLKLHNLTMWEALPPGSLSPPSAMMVHGPSSACSLLFVLVCVCVLCARVVFLFPVCVPEYFCLNNSFSPLIVRWP